ncbi:hypothetical protein KDW49_23550 [Burkholderia dolosa]|uniref:hypothetical protein n=1 Tax=Burkholderia dolosa TaxID=152500 RepID=UPI001B91CC4C|nr:hypothetical protein [Burkholderia dolosa]MBR8303689.1 hypothetical protein [Burkholderia dolosa]
MTVTSSIQDVTYATDGVSTYFNIPFYFLRETDIVADLISQANGASTPLRLGTDFTVLGAGNTGGGTFILTVAAAFGNDLHIQRVVPVTQETEYQQNDPFPAKTTEKAFDKLTMIAQQLNSAVQNAIRYPANEYRQDGTLAPALDRANTMLGWDARGNQTYLPIPASVGAGDLRDEEFTAGIDFTPGVTTSLRLSRKYAKSNVTVHFDLGFQMPSTYRITDYDLEFLDDAGNVSPIPEGVEKVCVKGGTSLSLNAPGLVIGDDQLAYGLPGYYLTTTFFGATGGGVVSDRHAFQLAANHPAGGKTETIFVPAGTYYLDADVVAGDGIVNWIFDAGAKLTGPGKLPFHAQTMAYNATPNVGSRFSIWHGTDANPTTDGVKSSAYIQRVDKSATGDDPNHLISALYVTHKRLTGGTGWLYGTYSYLEDQSNTTQAQSVAVAGAYHGKISGAGWGIYGEANSHSQFVTITAGEFDAINQSGVDYPYYATNPVQPPPNNNFSCSIWVYSVGKRNSFGVGIGAQNSPQTTGGSFGAGIYMQTWSCVNYGIDIQAQPQTLINFKYGASTDGTGVTPGGIGLDVGPSNVAAYGTAPHQCAIHLRDQRLGFGSYGFMQFNASNNYLEFWTWNGTTYVRRGYLDLSGADHAI